MIHWDREQICKILMACPLALIKCSSELVPMVRDYTITDIVSYKIYGKISNPEGDMLVLVLQNLIFMIVFEILFADYVSKHFRYSSVYVFTRLQNRRRWYAERLIEMAVLAVLYIVLYIGTMTAICVRNSSYGLRTEDIRSLLVLAVSAFFLTWNAVMLINVISLRWGIMVGFFCVQAGMVTLYALAKVCMNYSFLMIINPITSINILAADSSTILQMFAGNLIWTAAIGLGSMYYVEKYDVALLDGELS